MKVAGLELLVKCDGPLDDGERELLSCFEREDPDAAVGELKVHVTEAALWERTTETSAPVGCEPRVWAEQGGIVRIGHALFQAEIDPGLMCVRVSRVAGRSRALHIALKLALSVVLPRLGGVCLHAAGLVFDFGGVVFFGVSGAGKSTLSGLAPVPVLSDEFVPLVPEGDHGFRMVGTPFWGTMAPVAGGPVSVRVAAIVELHKGPAFLWSPIPSADRLARLVRVLAVPCSAEAARAALEPLHRVAEAVPAFRMSWSPAEPPFAMLREQMAAQPTTFAAMSWARKS